MIYLYLKFYYHISYTFLAISQNFSYNSNLAFIICIGKMKDKYLSRLDALPISEYPLFSKFSLRSQLCREIKSRLR